MHVWLISTADSTLDQTRPGSHPVSRRALDRVEPARLLLLSGSREYVGLRQRRDQEKWLRRRSPKENSRHEKEVMPTYIVEGGHSLSGRIRPAGNKNAALPAIAATVMASEPVTLQNIPRIGDVETLLEIVLSTRGLPSRTWFRLLLDWHSKA